MQVGATGTWDAEGLETPCVLNNGSTYEMYYGGIASGVYQIGHATSPEGLVWTKDSQPVLSPGIIGEWDAGGIAGPHILYDGTNYKMWYNGKNTGGLRAIGYATSTDGISWTKDASNPVLDRTLGEWDFGGVAYPNIIFEDDSYHFWYTGMGNGGIGDWEKGYATSTDGIDWTKYAENPVLNAGPELYDYRGLWASSTLYEDGVYKMWYVGSPSWYSNINYATSDTAVVALVDDLIHPKYYSLHQNYPNPFNPVTTIQYDLPQRSAVQITIYDLLGRKVTTLVSENQDAGYKSVIWDATNDKGQPVSAGMYFYRLQAGDYTETNKMLYLK